MSFTTSEVILLFMQNPNNVWNLPFHTDFEASDDMREVFCSFNPRLAYRYARFVDNGPHDLTRAFSSKEARYAYNYAFWIDQKGHSVTAKGVVGDEYYENAYRNKFGIGWFADNNGKVKKI